ncbi:MAG: hypothetical protein ACKO96_37085 [Flammeovirgaceae bacterium]
MENSRRQFLQTMGLFTAYGLTSGIPIACSSKSAREQTSDTQHTTEPVATKDLFFKISLAEWSLHKMLI